jgi:hypothetical protein
VVIKLAENGVRMAAVGEKTRFFHSYIVEMYEKYDGFKSVLGIWIRLDPDQVRSGSFWQVPDS